MKIRIIFLILISFFIFENLIAKTENELVNKISKNLRCIICQGQSVYDSNSEFALSIKLIIKKKINEGKSEKEIYSFFKDQYGEWILYDPELNEMTFVLWGLPIILFVFGGFLIFRKIFRN